ncbi:MAG TPA: transporter substrate-binding domain-containing protein [Casimicrobiaceae bacterium]|nr:transporter substrate-binding domain-containing protein [Casimicrobiaceae bacterium]
MWKSKALLLFGFIATAFAGASAPAVAQSGDVLSQLVAASALTKATKAKELRVGWSTWFPFMYVDPKTGKLTGFSVDLYEQHLAKAMGVKIVWVEQPWSTMMAGLQSGKFDVVANGNRTFQRLLASEYAGPITVTGKALMTTKANLSKYKDWHAADNPNTKICVALGTSADTEVTKFLTHANILRLEGDPACIAAVGGQRADVYATDIGNLVSLTKEHPEFAVIPNSTFTKTELGIFVRQGDQIMLNWLNQFIRDVKLQGTIDELIKKYNLAGVDVAW